MVVHEDLLLMAHTLVHRLRHDLGLEILPNLLCILLLLQHLVQNRLLGLLGTEGGLTTHGIAASLSRVKFLASILLHLLFQHTLDNHSILGLLKQLELLELHGLIHVQLVLVQ